MPAPGQSANRAAPKAHQESAPATELPITHVSLYKNGVGFFEHAGRVSGDQSVRIDLTTAQLNDVLQSLTAIDLNGGHITGAGYNSTTPLEQQLRALPLSLGEAPTQQDLYDSLRGARVEVTGAGAVFTGRVLALESRSASLESSNTAASASINDEARPAIERRYLTVAADSGALRTIELSGRVVVRLLDAGVRADLNTYLALLDSNRTQGMRHLILSDRGTGMRDLRVSFLSEVPVWKSTYRILFTDDAGSKQAPTQSATLQGFSVVDNTTGEDWKNVQLSLIAGSPQSFIQPLAQPIYSRRPEVPIAQDAQLTPQTHDSAVESAPANAPVATMQGMAGGAAGGMLGGMGNGSGGGVLRAGPARKSLAGPQSQSQSVTVQSDAPMIPYETIASNSTTPNTTTAAFDDYFAYNLTDPVTIPRNGSALVPILQTKIDSERVTLWSPNQPPLRALWITNASDLTLDQGSFSIVENGAFGGEGLLETIHPGERRLLSYAADQAVRVTVDSSHDTTRVTSISTSKGVLSASSTEIAEVEYLVHNAAPEARTVVIEQPRRSGWTLDSEPKPSETTATAYRFRVATAPRETVRLHIGERHTASQLYRLTDSTEEQLTVFLRNANAASALQQLEPVFAAKRALSAIDAQIKEKQDAINQLIEDQKRLRDNLGALKGSAEERALAKRYTAELNAQEDTLANLRRDLGALEEQRKTADADLSTKIQSLTIDEKLGS